MSNNKQVFAFELMYCFSIIYNRINYLQSHKCDYTSARMLNKPKYSLKTKIPYNKKTFHYCLGIGVDTPLLYIPGSGSIGEESILITKGTLSIRIYKITKEKSIT